MIVRREGEGSYVIYADCRLCFFHGRSDIDVWLDMYLTIAHRANSLFSDVAPGSYRNASNHFVDLSFRGEEERDGGIGDLLIIRLASVDLRNDSGGIPDNVLLQKELSSSESESGLLTWVSVCVPAQIL